MKKIEIEATVLEILKREIRLVCREDQEDGCETWMVKPGNLERCAQIIADAVWSDNGHIEAAMAEIERLRDDLSQALRQWRMYAESYDEVDLEHDDHAEGLLYRQILGRLSHQQLGAPTEKP